MRAYITVSGVIFGLMVVAHLWRVAAESASLARDPSFIAITLAAAGLSLWAGRLLWRSR